MLEPKWDLPPGVYVDSDRDARTVDVLNRSDAPVVAHAGDVMRSFGVTVGEEDGTVLLAAGRPVHILPGRRLPVGRKDAMTREQYRAAG